MPSLVLKTINKLKKLRNNSARIKKLSANKCTWDGHKLRKTENNREIIISTLDMSIWNI